MITFKTNFGDFTIELYNDKAPVTCENFLQYCKSGFYSGTIFHRVIKGFMVQGGGLTSDMEDKDGNAPIKNEADNGLCNNKYTIAMARTMDPNSATSQFFINTKDNTFLNHTDKSLNGWGYCVFGKVVEGTETIDKIEDVKTTRKGIYRDVPTEEIVIIDVVVE